eukprot:180222_1
MQQNVMYMSKNKSPTRDRIHFEKKMEHEMHVILDFMENICKYVIIKYTKLDTQTKVRIGLVFKTICDCNEVTPWIICYSITTDMVTLIIIYFLVLINGNIRYIYVEESDMFYFLYGQRGLDVNLDIIGLGK